MKKIVNVLMHLFCFGALLSWAACNGKVNQNAQNQADMETRNENTVRAILAAMDAGELAKFDLYMAADYQIYNPFLPTPGNLDTFKGLMQGQKIGFPDVKHEVLQMFSKGNMVCVRGIFSGTNTGSMQNNPPTGNRVVVPFIFTDEFNAEGKVKARHVKFDTGAFNAQLMAQR